jgi:hypothetical protein
MPTHPCLAAAIAYLKLGWSVIPLCTHDHAGVPGVHQKECTSPGAAPLWPSKQYQEKALNESALRLLWSRCPACNVGIVMGPVSNLIGFDVDGPAGMKFLADLTADNPLPPTLQFDTPGGGLRYLFQWPKEYETRLRTLAPGSQPIVRILAEGTQIAAPPSIHWTGKPYTWRRFHDPETLQPAKCPAWLIEHLLGCELPAKPAPEPEHETHEPEQEAPESEHAAPASDASESLASAAGSVAGSGNGSANHAASTTFASITKKEISWLWPDWLALGKLAVLDGDPGLGKSTLLLDLAARVSSVGIMPDQKQGATGNVLIMSAEDTAEDTIKPRLQAAGADEQRIINLSHAFIRGEEQPLEIPADLPLIAAKIKEHQARLLIIDPLTAFLCGADANKDQEIRRVLYKLSRIAEKHRCAVVCMRHLTKRRQGKAIYRGNSSIAVIGHARTGLLVSQDPDDKQKRILAVSKCNLGPRPLSLRFVLELHNGVPRISWCGQSGYDADQLVQAPHSEEETDRKETAKRKLAHSQKIIEMLLKSNGGKIKVTEVKAELRAAGIGTSTIDRAHRTLKLKLTYEIAPDGKREYYWFRD